MAAAAICTVLGVPLLVWGYLRPYADLQRGYAFIFGLPLALCGAVLWWGVLFGFSIGPSDDDSRSGP